MKEVTQKMAGTGSVQLESLERQLADAIQNNETIAAFPARIRAVFDCEIPEIPDIDPGTPIARVAAQIRLVFRSWVRRGRI